MSHECAFVEFTCAQITHKNVMLPVYYIEKTVVNILSSLLKQSFKPFPATGLGTMIYLHMCGDLYSVLNYKYCLVNIRECLSEL